MVSIDNAHVLSNVHTDCQYQVIPESNYAITRFKLCIPSKHSYERVPCDPKIQKTKQGRPEGDLTLDEADQHSVTEDESRETEQFTDKILAGDFDAGSDHKHHVFDKEIKVQFDEDGDLDVDRCHCTGKDFLADINQSNDSGELSKRKKIKLDLLSRTTCANSLNLDKEKQKQTNEHLMDGFDEVIESDIIVEESESCSSCYTKEGTCTCCEDYDLSNKQCQCKCVSSLHENKHCSIHACKQQPYKRKQRIKTEGISDITASRCIFIEDAKTSPKGGLSTSVKEDNCSHGGGGSDTDLDTYYINIKHSLATDLEDVGEQVWHGALLLSDYIISYHGEFENKSIIDLGAGVGLSSIVAAMFAKRVFCTDTGEKILSLADENVCTATTCPTLPRPLGTVHVKQLNWLTGLEVENCKHGLTEDDITSIYNCDLLIAADVIYDFDLTDAFFNVVKQIMSHPPAKTLYMGLEKRLVFTVEDLAVTSPGYNYFRIHLDNLCTSEEADDNINFEVEQIVTTFQKYFHYKRIKQLEIWKITAVLQDS